MNFFLILLLTLFSSSVFSKNPKINELNNILTTIENKKIRISSNNFQNLDSLCKSFDNLSNLIILEGDLTIEDLDIYDLNSLKCMKGINGNVTLKNLKKLENFIGFEFLEFINGSLIIENNQNLNSFLGLVNLKMINGNFIIKNNPSLKNISRCFPEFCEYNLVISNNLEFHQTGLKDIYGIEEMRFSSLILSNNEHLKNIIALEFVSYLDNLIIEKNKSLEDLYGLENLNEVKNSFIIDGNPKLKPNIYNTYFQNWNQNKLK